MTLPVGKRIPDKPKVLRGFTLLELMLVIVIMGIMVAVSIPSFSGVFAQTRLTTATSSLASALGFAGRLAVMERLSCRLNCDTQQGTYWLSIEKDPLEAPGTYSKPDGHLGKDRSLPQGIKISKMLTPRGVSPEQEKYICASPNGKMEEALLYLTNEKGEIYTIFTSKTFSRVKTFDYEYQPQREKASG